MYFKFIYYFLLSLLENSLHAVGWIFVLLFVVHKQVQKKCKKLTKK